MAEEAANKIFGVRKNYNIENGIGLQVHSEAVFGVWRKVNL